MTLQQLLLEGTESLKAAGIDEAGLDARYLLMEAFHLDTVQFLMERNRKLSEDEVACAAKEAYEELIRHRSEHIPLQYLCGTQEFMGLTFLVNPSVLIPRQDTETLVELVLKEQTEPGKKVLDMCTGSGCIAVSLKKLGGYEQVTAVDISEKALETARQNAKRNDADICFLKSDLFEALAPGKHQYDVIVSNPPYIKSQVIEELTPEVRDHEPRLALDGMEDGLYFYRLLASRCGEYLSDGGCVYFEIGFDQAKEVCSLLLSAGYESIEVVKDGPGLDRVVKAVLVKTGGSYV